MSQAKSRKAKNIVFRRNRLSLRIAFITIISSLFSILTIELTYLNTSNLIDNYNKIIDVDYKDIEMMDAVMVSVYEHQAIIFHHMAEQKPDRKSELIKRAGEIENVLKENMKRFEENVHGTQYEAGYHDMFSLMTSYMKNVKMVVELSQEGDEQTAHYYMQTKLEPIVNGMNKHVKNMDEILQRDISELKSDMKSNTELMRIIARMILAALVLAALFNVSYCVRISNEMISRDLLTGVANFDQMIRVGERMSRSRRRNRLDMYSGLAISIKDFKFINQEYGSLIGDLVLKGYAKYLNDRLNKGEVLARNGGDNFIALVEKEHVDEFLSQIEKVPVEVGEKMGLTLTTRCGIYQINPGDTIYDAINAGLIAVDETRLSGTGDYVWFRQERRDEMIRRKEIISGYHKAIDEEEFVVYYQPKVNLKTRTLCGCEALVRWIKNGELVPPGSFIPVLENDGKVQELDFYVFERVCRDIGDWQRRGIQPVRVSSNFSKLHLHNKDFAKDVLSVVDKYGADPYYLEAELTESSGYEDLNALVYFVSEMREAGIHTSMDDFGTGYSSLSLLRDIDMDVIKLDRTFLRDQADPKEEKMVENIVRMIHDLNRHVLCEGVETEEQVDFLKRVGCTMAQGFLFDRPLTREEFEKRLINPYYS
ncbi:MAG TPA: hypothetical protein DCP06_04550 [Lachnospiraceae bacterium]|nr:hypothetical protein [Lachnospiraceae bacterium]